MGDFQPAPYSIAPALDDDAEPPKGCGKLLTLRRYLCIATIEGQDFPAVICLGRHHATLAAALAQLEADRGEYPSAQVTSLWLAFDPEVPEQVDAFVRLSEDSERELMEAH